MAERQGEVSSPFFIVIGHYKADKSSIEFLCFQFIRYEAAKCVSKAVKRKDSSVSAAGDPTSPIAAASNVTPSNKRARLAPDAKTPSTPKKAAPNSIGLAKKFAGSVVPKSGDDFVDYESSDDDYETDTITLDVGTGVVKVKRYSNDPFSTMRNAYIVAQSIEGDESVKVKTPIKENKPKSLVKAPAVSIAKTMPVKKERNGKAAVGETVAATVEKTESPTSKGKNSDIKAPTEAKILALGNTERFSTPVDVATSVGIDNVAPGHASAASTLDTDLEHPGSTRDRSTITQLSQPVTYLGHPSMPSTPRPSFAVPVQSAAATVGFPTVNSNSEDNAFGWQLPNVTSEDPTGQANENNLLIFRVSVHPNTPPMFGPFFIPGTYDMTYQAFRARVTGILGVHSTVLDQMKTADIKVGGVSRGTVELQFPPLMMQYVWSFILAEIAVMVGIQIVEVDYAE